MSRNSLLCPHLIKYPMVSQPKLDDRKDHDDGKQNPGKYRRTLYVHVIKYLAIEIEHGDHGIVGRAAVGHDVYCGKASLKADGNASHQCEKDGR